MYHHNSKAQIELDLEANSHIAEVPEFGEVTYKVKCLRRKIARRNRLEGVFGGNAINYP